MDRRTDAFSTEAHFERLLEHFRGVHLESWRSQSEDVLRKNKDRRAGFEHRLWERWGEALNEYEVVVETALMMWWQFNKGWFYPARAKDDHKTVSLIELHSRCCCIAQEVLALLSGGFAAGAHARVRTMHELAVVAFFIKDRPPDVARRYQEHSIVERYKRAIEYNRTLPVTHAERGYEPIEEKTVSELSEQRGQLREKYGASFPNVPYGWAAATLRKPRPTLRDLEESVDMGHNRPFYAWSSQHIHPSSHGNQLSYLQQGNGAYNLVAGSSNGGLADPAASAMISLHQTVTALCLPLEEREYPEESCMVEEVAAYRIAEVYALGEMVEEAQHTFLEAHRKLEEDEKLAWDELRLEDAAPDVQNSPE